MSSMAASPLFLTPPTMIHPWLLLLCISLHTGITSLNPAQALASPVPPTFGYSAGVELTLVHGADSKGAVCLDGSLPGYHLDPGTGIGLNSWIVHLQGGAWCADPNSCALRAQTSLGSSHLMNASTFQGILSGSSRENPFFYNWNRVKVRYCDGGSFSGNLDIPMPARIPGKNQLQLLHYRGQRIWQAVMEDLLGRGMTHATQGSLLVVLLL